MIDDNNSVIDSQIWKIYADAILRKALEGGGVENGFDPARQHFSVGSTMLFVDVANTEPDRANTAVFITANSLPAESAAYVADGDLFTSYWLFLNYAMMGLKHPVFSELSNTKLLAPLRQRIPPMPRRPSGIAGSLLGKWLTGIGLLPDPGRRLLGSANDCLTASDSTTANSLNMPVLLSEGTVRAFAPRYTFENMAAIMEKWRKNAAAGGNAVVINILDADDEKNARNALPGTSSFWGMDVNPLHILDAAETRWHIFATFDGLDAVRIVPGGWFQRDLINTFMYDLPPQAPHFFGQSGSMYLLPVYAVLGYHPKVTISSETPAAHNAWIQALSDQHIMNKRLGPFPIPAGHGQTGFEVNHEDLTITFNGGSSDIPVLLGMISDKLA